MLASTISSKLSSHTKYASHSHKLRIIELCGYLCRKKYVNDALIKLYPCRAFIEKFVFCNILA